MASFLIVAAILMGIFLTSNANDFIVGWVQNPKESFNAWTSRMRFQVNDNLVFKYDKAEDSVLMVKKEDYDACNVKNPIQKLDDSSFQLTRSGPFYFISGVEEKCLKGEKLTVVVLAERKPVIPGPPTSPSTKTPPPSPPPLKPPTQSPTPPSMQPGVSPPTSSLAPSGSSPSPPSSSMAPSVASSPSSSPSSSVAPSVSSSPSSSMAPNVSSPSSPSSSMAPRVASSPSSSMAPSVSSGGPAASLVPPMQAPSPFNGGNEPVASPTSADNAKSPATALTGSSLTTMMGAIMILGQALLLG